MAMLDEDFGTGPPPLTGGDNGVWPGPEAEHDWRRSSSGNGRGQRSLITLPPPTRIPGGADPVTFGPDTEPPLSRRRPPLTMSVRSPYGPSSARPARASCGTSSPPATTTLATRPWSAPRSATPSTTVTDSPLPCSASAPPPGSSPRPVGVDDPDNGGRGFPRRSA